MLSVAKDLFPYASQTLRIDGHSLRYIDTGDSASGDGLTILCVHGNPTWSFYYRRVIERFSPRCRVVAVDHIGCGRSDKPPANEFAYTMAAHRDNLVRVIDELNLQNIVLLAHDWGGAIGLSAVHARRERLRGITLLNTAAFPPPYMPRRIAACRWPIVGTPAVRGLNLFARAAITMAMSRTKLSSDAARGLLEPYNSWENRVAIDRFVHDIPLSPSHPTLATLRELEAGLPDFSIVPIQLIWGMKDWCFRPECLRRFQQVWPHAAVKELPTTGHYVLEDSPDETLATMESFLAQFGIPAYDAT
ncbi:alpha/beta fold hydrolase [Aporhodopirellula aestuarii]|uniref:Alpha/beta fold hydrolase n=1 Tax=Aporhodopirellula aestuarii TaxID=2950107 RepID=A0ABT0U469_9BACT|nr:alpha/beta fold hydrolase [Aporhodopirellula aestuarii]MCM2371697.1 alpha/beta fold hydrolase [Aporhodopirellula aestuarii]